MKKIKELLFVILFFIITNQAYSQVVMTLQVYEPLPPLNFASLATIKDLENTPEIFRISFFPEGVYIRLEGDFHWQDVGTSQQKWVSSFTTKDSFKTKSFTNNQISKDLKVNITSNGDVVKEILAKGKPTGTFILTLRMLTASGVLMQTISKTLEFLNPSQSIKLISPAKGSFHDPGNVFAQWTDVPSVDHYVVKANVRRNANQSLEEALNQGNPIINNKNVGNITTVNLRSILDREWAAGDEIVLQAAAYINAPGGGNLLYSEIINFYINDPGALQLQTITNQVSGLLQNLPQLANNPLIAKLIAGGATIKRIVGDNGLPMSTAEVTALLTKLAANPDLVANITIIEY